jgi:hypothetical protein
MNKTTTKIAFVSLNNKLVFIMKKIFFITVIMATLALSGCLRHCEGFPPQMQQTYFPYTSGQALTFVSNEGDSLSLNVTSVSMDGPYNIGFGVKETCGPYLYVKLEGKINHTNHELNIELFYEGQRENDYDVTWTPTYNKPYYSQVTIWAGGNSYCLAYLSYIDGRMEMDRIRSLHDTICYANVDGKYTESTIDTLMVVKDRGLAGFSTSDGRKYVLTE